MKRVLYRRGRLGLVFLTLCWLLGGRILMAKSWIREGPPSLSSDPHRSGGPFELKVVRCDDGHLTGLAVLTRYSLRRDYKREAVTIKGVETNDHRFWPNVTLQVADQIDGDWQTIERVPTSGTMAARRVDPQTPGEAFFVNLDPFSRWIGRSRYGRLLLEDGDDVMFDLHRLVPPADAEVTDGGSWSREPEQLYPSFSSRTYLYRRGTEIPRLSLIAVSLEDNHLLGTFPYGLNLELGDPLASAGSEDQNFWPTVTAEVSNDDQNGWEKIGESSKPGQLYKPTVPPRSADWLHVDLQVFKPFIGKFRYGRITLENGDSAIFELVNLLPPEK
jgi:hypothetical protein